MTMKNPRRFRLTDKGRTVANGVVWSDDSCSIRWYADMAHFSTVHWPDSTKAMEHAFGRIGGLSYVLEWIDSEHG